MVKVKFLEPPEVQSDKGREHQGALDAELLLSGQVQALRPEESAIYKPR